MADAIWTSSAGKTYEFIAYRIDSQWHAVAGVYCFAQRNGPGWTIHYIGQTDNFSQRFPHHERWAEASRHGAELVLACTVVSGPERDSVEQEMCRQVQPNLNTHHVGLLHP